MSDEKRPIKASGKIRVIDITGKSGRSVTIGLGTWPPPKLKVIDGGPADETESKPAEGKKQRQ